MEEAKAKCPSCGSSFPAGATYCPECGYGVPVTAAAVTPVIQKIVPPAPQSNVVYVQPPVTVPRESNWGPWIAMATVVILVAGGIALWNGGYLSSSTPATPAAPAATTVTIDNSTPPSTEKPPAAVQLAIDTTPAAMPPPAVTPPAAEKPAKSPAIDIITVKGAALETGAMEWKYGYTLQVRNNTDAAVTTSFRVQFLDEQDFPVDDDVMNDLVIPANTELSFEGQDMIKTALAERIRTLRAEVR